MNRFSLLLLAPLTTLPVLGCESATEGSDTRRSEIRLDFGEILRPSTSAQQGIAVSVIDEVTLTVEEEDGSSRTFSETLAPGESEVVFVVQVDAGLVNFSADVLSNNGTLLYTGSAEEEISEDGFEAVITVEPVAPVMVVFPDSIELDPSESGSVDIRNRGIGTLAWQVGDISPANTCRIIGTIDVFGPCLDFEIESGTVDSAEAAVLFVFTPADTAEKFNLELTSEQGIVTILVSVVRLQPVKLAFLVQPTSTTTGTIISPPVEVAIQDILNRTVTNAQDVITISIGQNTGGGSLSGTTTVTAVNGVAVFEDLSIGEQGAYTLVAESGQLDPAESNTFSVAIPLAEHASLRYRFSKR